MVDRVALVVERYGEFIAWASYERWAGRDDADAAFHGRRRATTARASPRCSSSTSRRSPGPTASPASRPRCSPTTGRCSPCSAAPGGPSSGASRAASSTSTSRSTRPRSSSTPSSAASSGPTRGPSPASCCPRTIAVVGASDTPGSVGEALWRHVTRGATGAGVPGQPAPRRRSAAGRAWPTLQRRPRRRRRSPSSPSPPPRCRRSIEDCIASHVRGAVIITSVEGTDIDVAAARRARPQLRRPPDRPRQHGHRLVRGRRSGCRPRSCRSTCRPATSPSRCSPGSLGASVLRLADELRMGLSWFVSLGDKSDVSGNDLLQFWEDDETTRVIAMYTESFGNPRKFARIARRVSRHRPIVAVRTGAAAIGPSGGALYQQAGLIEVPTVAAMLDTARVLATQPVMRGPRVAVLANARSPATLSRAALDDRRADRRRRTRRASTGGRRRPTTARPCGPRSTADDVDARDGRPRPAARRAVAAPVADDRRRAAADSTKPVVAVLMGGRNGPLRVGLAAARVRLPRAGRRACSAARTPTARGCSTRPARRGADVADIDRAKVAAVIAAALERGATELDTAEVVAVLSRLRHRRARRPRAARPTTPSPSPTRSATRSPSRPQHRHLGRSVRAGVALDLGDADDVTHALAVMQDAIGDDAADVVVQPMVAPGPRPAHPQHVRRPPRPARGDRARQLDGRPRHRRGVAAGAAVVGRRRGAARRLARRAGARSTPASRRTPCVDTLMRVAQLVGDHPEITSADLNPIIASAERRGRRPTRSIEIGEARSDRRPAARDWNDGMDADARARRDRPPVPAAARRRGRLATPTTASPTTARRWCSTTR